MAESFPCETASHGPRELQWDRHRSMAERWSPCQHRDGLDASMGPPSIDGGEPGLCSPVPAARLASMGPPSIDGGEPGLCSPVPAARLASMGPPSIDGGEIGSAPFAASSYSLQWDRHRSMAERSLCANMPTGTKPA